MSRFWVFKHPASKLTWEDAVCSGELTPSASRPTVPSSPLSPPSPAIAPPEASQVPFVTTTTSPNQSSPFTFLPRSSAQAPSNTLSENPSASELSQIPLSVPMAYRFVDPTPFLPRGSHRRMVGFLKPMARVVLGGPRRSNCDVAIANIEPLPLEQVSF